MWLWGIGGTYLRFWGWCSLMGNGREMNGKWEMFYIFYRGWLMVNFIFLRVKIVGEWCVCQFPCSLYTDISIGSQVIRGSQNLEIRSRDPGHAHSGVTLWFARRRGASSMSVPNLKRIALFVQKLLGVPKFRNWVTDPKPRPFWTLNVKFV